MPSEQTAPAAPVPHGASEGNALTPSYRAAVGEAICGDVAEGVPLPAAFLCHGVPAAAGQAWLESQADFAHAVEVARARYLRSLIKEVREAVAGSGARHDWRASLALLEREDKRDPSSAGKTVEKSIDIFSPGQLIDLQARRRAALG